MAKVDVQQQTGIDMANARARTSIDVSHVRNFLHRELHLPVGVNICRTIPHIQMALTGGRDVSALSVSSRMILSLINPEGSMMKI